MAADQRLRNPRPEAAGRRTPDRLYAGVFAAETRRLARQLRTPHLGRATVERALARHNQPEVSP